MQKVMAGIPGITDVNSDLKISSPLVVVDIDRDRASSLGVTADRLRACFTAPMRARQISTIYTPISITPSS